MIRQEDARLPRMDLSVWGLSILHQKNPWMPMWWSAALPGLGHLCQGFYFKGLNLILWEIVVNFKARLNLAILFTFTGNLEKAREVVNAEWALVYGAIFCFAVFDSYRLATELNLLAAIERRQKKRKYRFIKMTVFGTGYLDRGNPWVAAAWSALLPGFGHIYNMKAVKSVVILIWTLAIIHFSHVNKAIIATFTGEQLKAGALVNYQWLLFFPSVYIFSIWDAYCDAVEMNKLFAEEQSHHLLKKFGKRKRG
jgi:hypothetical protein